MNNKYFIWTEMHLYITSRCILRTYLLTYSIVQSPSWAANWFAASQEIPRISRNPKGHTALTSVRHLSLSWVSPIQFIYPHPTSWSSILILSTHLRLGLPSSSFPPGSPPRPYTPPLLTHKRHISNPSHSSRFYHPHNTRITTTATIIICLLIYVTIPQGRHVT